MFSMEVTIIDGAVFDLFLEAAVADLLEAVHDVEQHARVVEQLVVHALEGEELPVGHE